MKVLTLDSILLAEECRRLAECVNNSGFRPDAVVAVRRGGSFVASAMAEYIGERPVFTVDCSRQSTRHKGNLMRTVLKCMPLTVRDWLRNVEHRFLTRRKTSPATVLPDVPSEISHYRRILILDDAVDTGVTLQAVYRAVSAAAPSSYIRTAVLTVTTAFPLIFPDYTLHRNLLLRFPWSLDA